MGKMHELLAVEASVNGNFNRDKTETVKVFGKPEVFTKMVTKKTHFDAASSHLDTIETKEMTTRVKDRLSWFRGSATAFFDLILQKDKTNQVAVSDLEVTSDGNTIVLAKDVPATTLLSYETKLQDLRAVFDSIPTLPSGIPWEFDSTENVYKSVEPSVTFSTKKTAIPVILFPATKEHPAQVKEMFEDVPIAKISKDLYAGMVTSAEKAEILGRLDILLQACKKARQKANDAETVKAKVGAAIFDFLYKGIVK